MEFTNIKARYALLRCLPLEVSPAGAKCTSKASRYLARVVAETRQPLGRLVQFRPHAVSVVDRRAACPVRERFCRGHLSCHTCNHQVQLKMLVTHQQRHHQNCRRSDCAVLCTGNSCSLPVWYSEWAFHEYKRDVLHVNAVLR